MPRKLKWYTLEIIGEGYTVLAPSTDVLAARLHHGQLQILVSTVTHTTPALLERRFWRLYPETTVYDDGALVTRIDDGGVSFLLETWDHLSIDDDC